MKSYIGYQMGYHFYERTHAVVWNVKQQRVLDPYVGRGRLKRHLSRHAYEASILYIVEVR